MTIGEQDRLAAPHEYRLLDAPAGDGLAAFAAVISAADGAVLVVPANVPTVRR